MKTENKPDEKDKNQTENKTTNIKNNEEKNNNNQNNNNKILNENDPDFDIATFCPDPDSVDKKIRSRTVRESVKKGKLKKFIEEEKTNKIDQKKYLKTPQVMVPRLRPQKPSLNPTPLKLTPISLKPTRLNSIKEEIATLSECEEESENSQSSSSSFFSDNEKEEEHKEQNQKKQKFELIKEEENEDEQKEEEEKEKVKDEEIKNDIKPGIGILGHLMEEKNKEEKNKNDEKNEENNLNENDIYEDKDEENELMSLREIRKNMKQYKRSFKIKRDTFNIIDTNIRNNYNKFKEDVLDEEKNNNNTNNNKPNDIDSINNTQKCCPILDFYTKNTVLKSNA